MTKSETINYMRRVSDAMIDLGGVMFAQSGKEWQQHGEELVNAGRMLAKWQSAVEKEENGR